jgi:hypothetical protein
MSLQASGFKAHAWLLLLALGTAIFGQAATEGYRPPAVPLVAHDPYFSIWSTADRLTDDRPRHWTGRPHALTALVRVDGKTFRAMGRAPREAPAMAQAGLRITPTRTAYLFEEGGVGLSLSFLTPQLIDDLTAKGAKTC